MDKMKNKTVAQESASIVCYANQLGSLFQDSNQGVKLLSLDCFDTLLWRRVMTPKDVFYLLQDKPAFRAIGMDAVLREEAENKARLINVSEKDSLEVTFRDIYLAHDSTLSDEMIDELIEIELSIELEVCYAFSQTIELIRHAHASGIKIIIVSDTYMREKQLRRLLQFCLPADVYPLIAKIFCSCEYGVGKTRGLFEKILKEMRVDVKAVVHLGDNLKSDVESAKKIGIKAVHLKQLSLILQELRRAREFTQLLFDQSIRYTRPLVDPFHEIIASIHGSNQTAEHILGFYSLGPILFSFSLFIRERISKLRNNGKNPKILFLMRDGYLPSLSYEILFDDDFITRIRISRFASYAASFVDKKSIEQYIFSILELNELDKICKQLLIPQAEADFIIKTASSADDVKRKFCQLILEKKQIEKICEASKQYRNRLYAYLKKTIQLEKGDTLVFVDLGYLGTSQIKLAPIFQKELGVEILGQYLIAFQTPGWEKSRSGLLDTSWCDLRQLKLLTKHIAIFEQLCTSADESVIDYDKEGNPLYASSKIGHKQNETRNKIQLAALEFIRYMKSLLGINQQTIFHSKNCRDFVASELARLIWFPVLREIQLLNHFEFEINMGSENLLNLFDIEKGLSGLRRRSLFFMEGNMSTMRLNYPTELRFIGLEFSTMLFSVYRSQSEFYAQDMTYRTEKVSCVIQHKDNTVSAVLLEARYTYDGFYALLLPFTSNQKELRIEFGKHYHWIEIDCAQVIMTDSLYTDSEQESTKTVTDSITWKSALKRGVRLYESQDMTASMHFFPENSNHNKGKVLRVVYRPIEKYINNQG